MSLPCSFTYHCTFSETLVGVRLPVIISVRNEGSSQVDPEVKTLNIFASSVQVLWPGLPKTWGDVADIDGLKDEIIDNVQAVLPCDVQCFRHTEGKVRIQSKIEV